MRQLFPTPADDVDPDLAYADDRRPTPSGRPWLLLNFISSLDGAIEVNGRSGALGGPADRQVFRSLRALADIILVGAGTVRAESYGPPVLSDALQHQRRERGQTDLPRIAVCTTSLNLDYGSRLFTESPTRPIVIAPSSTDPERRARASEVADVVVAGDDEIDLSLAQTELHRLGARTVLCEGGPTLAGHLAAANLIDEMCLTLSGVLVGGRAPRLLNGPTLDPIQPMTLTRILEADGLLFLRYARTST